MFYDARISMGMLFTLTGTILTAFGLCVTSVLGGAAVNSLQHSFGGGGGSAGLFSGLIGGVILSVAAIIYGGGLALTLYAAGEGIFLLLALEENTRSTVALLQQQISK